MTRIVVLLLLASALAPTAAGHAWEGDAPTPGPPTGTRSQAGGQAPDVQALLDHRWSPELPVHAASAPSAQGWRHDRAGEYDLQFRCPPMARQEDSPPVCPAYVVDAEDVLGQPVLSVDPRQSSFVAFNALHGGPGPVLPGERAPPSDAARADDVHQPHTTFQSRDGGGRWDDNRYYARLDDAGRIWGTDNAMAADSRGHLTVVSVYAVDGEDSRQYKATLTSGERASSPVDYDREYVVRTTLEPGAVMRDAHAVHFPAADAMVVLWLEDGSMGPMLRVLHKSADSPWRDQDPDEAIGPCSAISNPVVQGDRLYVLCETAPGMEVDGVADGTVQLFAVTPGWNGTHVSSPPLAALGDLALADAKSGMPGGIVAAAAGVQGGKARVQIAFGVDGANWSPVKDFRDSFSEAAQRTATLVAARINALGYMGTSGTVHLIVAERYSGPEGPEGSPFAKTYGVLHHTGRLLGVWDLGYGDPASRILFPAHVAGLSAGVFADAKDSIVVHTTSSGDQRLFVAFGDHGVVRYAEILEIEPTLPGFPPISPASPVPAPLPGANPAVIGAVAGTLSAAAVARMVAAKKKKTAEAPTL